MSEVLTEKLSAVRFPVEDTRELLVTLARLELQADMLDQEEADTDKLIETAEATLEDSKVRESELREELAEQVKHQEDVEDLKKFARSLQSPKAVLVDGREVIADLHLTRQQEQDLYKQLESEYESLLQDKSTLLEFWKARHARYTELAGHLREWIQEYDQKDSDRSRGRQRSEKPEPQQTQEPQEPEQPEAGKSDRESDVEMEIE